MNGHPLTAVHCLQELQGTGKMEAVVGEDWTLQTLPSWLHSVWVGVVDPWIVMSKGPRIWYKTVREIVTLVRMHQVRPCDISLTVVCARARCVSVTPLYQICFHLPIVAAEVAQSLPCMRKG